MTVEEEPGAGLPVFPVGNSEPESSAPLPDPERVLYQPPFVSPGYAPPTGRPAPSSSPAPPAPSPAYQPPAPAPPPTPVRPVAAPPPPPSQPVGVQPLPGAPIAGAALPGAPEAAAPPPAPPPTAQVAPPAAAGPTARLTSNALRLRLALGAGALLLLVVGWLVSGALLSGMEASNQTTALQQTGTDMTKLDAFLVDTQVRDSKKTDSASLKVAIDAYQVKLTEADSTLAADQDRLDAINHDIDFYSIFTPLQSSKVHANDGTIRHAKAALNAVARAVSIWRTELAFFSALSGAEANADSADKAARNKDLTSTSDYYQKANALLTQCQLLVKDADVAPQFVPLIDAYSKVMKDVAGLADSFRAQDLPGVIAYLQQLVADDTVIDFDQSAYLAWYSEKFNPLLKDYRGNAVAVPRFVVTTTKLV